MQSLSLFHFIEGAHLTLYVCSDVRHLCGSTNEKELVFIKLAQRSHLKNSLLVRLFIGTFFLFSRIQNVHCIVFLVIFFLLSSIAFMFLQSLMKVMTRNVETDNCLTKRHEKMQALDRNKELTFALQNND